MLIYLFSLCPCDLKLLEALRQLHLFQGVFPIEVWLLGYTGHTFFFIQPLFTLWMHSSFLYQTLIHKEMYSQDGSKAQLQCKHIYEHSHSFRNMVLHSWNLIKCYTYNSCVTDIIICMLEIPYERYELLQCLLFTTNSLEIIWRRIFQKHVPRT